MGVAGWQSPFWFEQAKDAQKGLRRPAWLCLDLSRGSLSSAAPLQAGLGTACRRQMDAVRNGLDATLPDQGAAQTHAAAAAAVVIEPLICPRGPSGSLGSALWPSALHFVLQLLLRLARERGWSRGHPGEQRWHQPHTGLLSVP